MATYVRAGEIRMDSSDFARFRMVDCSVCSLIGCHNVK